MPEPTLRDLARMRWRVALGLSALMVILYFGFVLLVAFDKPLMGTLLVPGLSVGIVLGALVLLATWITTLLYVRWANRHVDAAVATLVAAGRTQ